MGHWHKVKYDQPHVGFELRSLIPFSMTVTVTVMLSYTL